MLQGWEPDCEQQLWWSLQDLGHSIRSSFAFTLHWLPSWLWFTRLSHLCVQANAWKRWSTMTTLLCLLSSSHPMVKKLPPSRKDYKHDRNQASTFLLPLSTTPSSSGTTPRWPFCTLSHRYLQYNARASVWRRTPGTKTRNIASSPTFPSLVESGLYLAVKITRWEADQFLCHAPFGFTKGSHYLLILSSGLHLEPANQGNCAKVVRTYWCGETLMWTCRSEK